VKMPSTFTAGYGGSRIRTYRALLRLHSQGTEQFARNDFYGLFNDATRTIRERLASEPGDVRILDVGCGHRPGVAVLFHSLGAEVIGIDYDIVHPRFSWRGVPVEVQRNGLERTLKTLGRRLLVDRRYYRELERLSGRPLRFEGLDLREMDACKLEFPDESFDFIYSAWVFEHLHDVDAAAREISRVLRPGGVARIWTHLFPSLSGGHCFDWSDPDNAPSTTVPPWDHLRGNRYPAHVFLNKLRADEYLRIFAKYVSIEDESYVCEGRDLLTEELKRELWDYSEADLTRNNQRLIVRKGEQLPSAVE
jgi:SAM-dependent methyltransferase